MGSEPSPPPDAGRAGVRRRPGPSGAAAPAHRTDDGDGHDHVGRASGGRRSGTCSGCPACDGGRSRAPAAPTSTTSPCGRRSTTGRGPTMPRVTPAVATMAARSTWLPAPTSWERSLGCCSSSGRSNRCVAPPSCAGACRSPPRDAASPQRVPGPVRGRSPSGCGRRSTRPRRPTRHAPRRAPAPPPAPAGPQRCDPARPPPAVPTVGARARARDRRRPPARAVDGRQRRRRTPRTNCRPTSRRCGAGWSRPARSAIPRPAEMGPDRRRFRQPGPEPLPLRPGVSGARPTGGHDPSRGSRPRGPGNRAPAPRRTPRRVRRPPRSRRPRPAPTPRSGAHRTSSRRLDPPVRQPPRAAPRRVGLHRSGRCDRRRSCSRRPGCRARHGLRGTPRHVRRDRRRGPIRGGADGIDAEHWNRSARAHDPAGDRRAGVGAGTRRVGAGDVRPDRRPWRDAARRPRVGRPGDRCARALARPADGPTAFGGLHADRRSTDARRSVDRVRRRPCGPPPHRHRRHGRGTTTGDRSGDRACHERHRPGVATTDRCRPGGRSTVDAGDGSPPSRRVRCRPRRSGPGATDAAAAVGHVPADRPAADARRRVAHRRRRPRHRAAQHRRRCADRHEVDDRHRALARDADTTATGRHDPDHQPTDDTRRQRPDRRRRHHHPPHHHRPRHTGTQPNRHTSTRSRDAHTTATLRHDPHRQPTDDTRRRADHVQRGHHHPPHHHRPRHTGTHPDRHTATRPRRAHTTAAVGHDPHHQATDDTRRQRHHRRRRHHHPPQLRRRRTDGGASRHVTRRACSPDAPVAEREPDDVRGRPRHPPHRRRRPPPGDDPGPAPVGAGRPSTRDRHGVVGAGRVGAHPDGQDRGRRRGRDRVERRTGDRAPGRPGRPAGRPGRVGVGTGRSAERGGGLAGARRSLAMAAGAGDGTRCAACRAASGRRGRCDAAACRGAGHDAGHWHRAAGHGHRSTRHGRRRRDARPGHQAGDAPGRHHALVDASPAGHGGAVAAPGHGPDDVDRSRPDVARSDGHRSGTSTGAPARADVLAHHPPDDVAAPPHVAAPTVDTLLDHAADAHAVGAGVTGRRRRGDRQASGDRAGTVPRPEAEHAPQPCRHGSRSDVGLAAGARGVGGGDGRGPVAGRPAADGAGRGPGCGTDPTRIVGWPRSPTDGGPHAGRCLQRRAPASRPGAAAPDPPRLPPDGHGDRRRPTPRPHLDRPRVAPGAGPRRQAGRHHRRRRSTWRRHAPRPRSSPTS